MLGVRQRGWWSDELSIARPTCTHLRRSCLSPESCQSRGERLGKDECNPCRRCKTIWLLESNSATTRLEQAKKSAQEERRPEKRQRTEESGNDESASPMTLNSTPHEAACASALTKPAGKKLTATQQRNRTCRKVGLPPKASPSEVKERLKRENPARDDREVTALKRSRVSSIVDELKQSKPLTKKAPREEAIKQSMALTRATNLGLQAAPAPGEQQEPTPGSRQVNRSKRQSTRLDRETWQHSTVTTMSTTVSLPQCFEPSALTSRARVSHPLIPGKVRARGWDEQAILSQQKRRSGG